MLHLLLLQPFISLKLEWACLSDLELLFVGSVWLLKHLSVKTERLEKSRILLIDHILRKGFLG